MRSEDSNNRLQRLRELVGRLEQLPGSEERDRVLSEVRARAVDLDTGETPRAMLPVDPDVLPAELLKPARVTVPRPGFVAPYKPRSAPIPATRTPPPPAPAPIVPTLQALVLDEQLSLEDAPAPQSQAPRAWERGLRG